ncbi:hypothetical protein [Nocardioides montaniterrae]
MTFHNEIELPWDYADLTEAIIEDHPQGKKLTLILWDEACELEVICKDVTISAE